MTRNAYNEMVALSLTIGKHQIWHRDEILHVIAVINSEQINPNCCDKCKSFYEEHGHIVSLKLRLDK